MIVQQPSAEFEIDISDRSFVTNATYQTDAQSKFPARRVIVQQPTAEFEIDISDRSFVTNATYQTDAQSKFSVSSEAKIVRIGAGSFKIFQSRPEKGTDGLSFFPLEGKIEQRI